MVTQMPSSSLKMRRAPVGAARPVDHSSKRRHRDDHDTRVEDFIGENALDERAAAALRGASPALRDAVMTRGSLRDTRNPSAALLGRLRDSPAILAVNVSLRPLEAMQEEQGLKIGVEDLTRKARDGGASKKWAHPPSIPMPQRTRNQMALLRLRLSRLSRVVDHAVQRYRLATSDANHGPEPQASDKIECGKKFIGELMASSEWFAIG